MRKWMDEHAKLFFALYFLYSILLLYGVMVLVFQTFDVMRAWSWSLVIFVFVIHCIAYVMIVRKKLIRDLTSMYGEGTEEFNKAMKDAKIPTAEKIRYTKYFILFFILFIIGTYFLCRPAYTLKEVSVSPSDGEYVRAADLYHVKINNIAYYIEKDRSIDEDSIKELINGFEERKKAVGEAMEKECEKEYNVYVVNSPLFHYHWKEDMFTSDQNIILNENDFNTKVYFSEFIYRIYEFPERWLAYGLTTQLMDIDSNRKELKDTYSLKENMKLLSLSDDYFTKEEPDNDLRIVINTAKSFYTYLELNKGISNLKKEIWTSTDFSYVKEKNEWLKSIGSDVTYD